LDFFHPHRIPSEEYLHREKNADFWSEYFRGEMFAMASASANRNLIAGNCVQTLGQQLNKKPCRDASDNSLLGAKNCHSHYGFAFSLRS
jgi:hypothetical protein